jgi:methionine-gamma-lyase
MDDHFGLTTLLVHGDDEAGAVPVAPPIEPSVPFASPDADTFAAESNRPRSDRTYRRYGNPTQSRLERALATAEGGEAALATASGMGAITTTFLALLTGGDHVVAQRSLYSGALAFLQDIAPGLGIDVTFVDQADTNAFEAAVTPRTKLFVLESPTNPLLRITDLQAVAAIARRHSVTTMVDSTIATPVNQRPLGLGIDLVVHSVTKSISGHSDVLAGAVIGRRELIEKIWHTHVVVGSVVSPFDAWLALRGLRTLPMRAERQASNAMAVARFLAEQPGVAKVNYPGLESHPQHELARRQMTGFGGLLSVELADGFEAAKRVVNAVKIFRRSPSLGGVHSLIVQPAAMWAQDLTPEQLLEVGVAPGLLRLAIGIEDAPDLITDLRSALSSIAAEAATT